MFLRTRSHLFHFRVVYAVKAPPKAGCAGAAAHSGQAPPLLWNGDNAGDSNDNNDSVQTPPPIIEGAAYDSAADASAYGEYYGLWEGSSGAKCDALAVSATDGGMYFTFCKDGEVMASGCAQVIEEYDQLYFFNAHDGCAYLARGSATELAELLIDRVLVYPDKRMEIAYKIRDIFDPITRIGSS